MSLGQLIRNPLFEEAEAEFQQVAFFKTRISLRNAFQDELTPNETGGVDPAADKEIVLITLTRPLIYLQPVAVDKAILVCQLGVGSPSLGTLFLQLTVDDMGICMPLNTAPTSLWMNSGRPEGNNRQGHSSNMKRRLRDAGEFQHFGLQLRIFGQQRQIHWALLPVRR